MKATDVNDPGAGNVISANGSNGVEIQGDNNLLRTNHIGTNAAGDAALGNAFPGVILFDLPQVTSVGTATGRNVISGNATAGVFIELGAMSASGSRAARPGTWRSRRSSGIWIAFLEYHNLQRSHQGYRLKGRTPAQALREALSVDEHDSSSCLGRRRPEVSPGR